MVHRESVVVNGYPLLKFNTRSRMIYKVLAICANMLISLVTAKREVWNFIYLLEKCTGNGSIRIELTIINFNGLNVVALTKYTSDESKEFEITIHTFLSEVWFLNPNST